MMNADILRNRRGNKAQDIVKKEINKFKTLSNTLLGSSGCQFTVSEQHSKSTSLKENS